MSVLTSSNPKRPERRYAEERERLRALILLIAVVGSLCGSGGAETAENPEVPQEKTSEPDFMALYAGWVAKLDLRLDVPGTDRKGAPRLEEAAYDNMLDCRVRRVEGPVYAVFDAGTGSLYAIANVALSKRLSRLKPDDPHAKSTWSQDRAVEEARRVLDLICPRSSRKGWSLELSQVSPPTSGKWYACAWEVHFVRKCGSHAFSGDFASVSIHEELGLLACGHSCVSEVPEVDVKIGKEVAIAEAKPFARKIIESREFAQSFRGWTLASKGTAELRIVNPNWLLTPKSTWGDGRRRPARLAWWVEFVADPPAASKAKGAGIQPHKIMVWVDAESGQILGGDSQN